MMTRPMPGCFWSVPRSIEMNTSICPVRRSWALKLLPDTRPAYGSYLSQSISLVASLNTPEKVSSVRLMKGPSASRTNLLVEALWMCASRLRNDASGWARYTTLLRAIELWGAVRADGAGRLAGDEELPPGGGLVVCRKQDLSQQIKADPRRSCPREWCRS